MGWRDIYPWNAGILVVLVFSIFLQMAKSISQAMFDDVVRENMEEFDMDAETAVAEAVEQFEAQVGIHLRLP